MWIFKFFCLCVLSIWTSAEEEALVDIGQGTLKGLKVATITGGKPYFSFKGIPYAQPNVGPNKFRAPEPAEPWQGVLDATKHRSACVFYCHIKQGLIGDEDCLFLNVYTPVLNKDAKKAVIVFIHPGGFSTGSGDDLFLGPDFLIDEDVILVTLNYRVGALGFLSTNDAAAPGNAGLKDQVMALKWVKENIQNFGGCPNRVTLAGESAGAASVQYHMISPMSKGLFKSAILQSGAILSGWALAYDIKDISFKLGEILGIKTTDSGELVKKLTEFSAKEIVDATKEITKTLNPLNGRLHPFIPVVEPQVGQDVFLSADPWELIKSAKFVDVPFIIGYNLDESLFLIELLKNADEINNNFERFVPNDLNITDSGKLKEIGESIKKFYLDGKPLTSTSVSEFTKITSDIYFTYSILISAQIMASKNKQPVYEYLFTFNSPVGFMKNIMQVQETGVSHGDELAYEFYSNHFKNKPESGSSSEQMTRIFTKLWTNFAKNRNPTNKLDDDITVNWEPLGPEGNYMNINVPLKMEKGLYKDRLKFWLDIYKDVLGEYASLFS